MFMRANPDMVIPPASLRWLAVRLGQTGRFALPSLVFVPQCAFVSMIPVFQFAIGGFIGYLANMTMAENKFLKEAIKQGLRMQHRFLAEPVLARTGKGYMKSEGVATLQRIKASMKKSKSA
jgi:hypothetical protein